MSDLTQYKQYDTELFSVRDTMGVPHPYTIGPRHVSFASDNHCGMLGNVAIEAGEKQGITCAMRGCQLSWKEHEHALAINCKSVDKKDHDALQDYLKTLVEQSEKDGFVGFVLVDCSKGA